MKQISKFFIFLLLPNLIGIPLYASEVIEETHTQVVVREHPKTGKPYVSIVASDRPLAEDPFVNQRKKTSRPNYRMLDPNVKPGEIPYDGPYSSSAKIYVFAATLATLGVAGGAIGMAAIPASAGGAASGGGAYLAAGSAVAAGTAGAVAIKTRPNPNQDDFTLISKSKSLEEKDREGTKEVTSSKESE